MYGTVAHIHPKPGQERGVIEYFEYWQRERKPQTPGALGGYVYQLASDPGTWILTVAFADQQSYMANAQSPQMDADYRRLRDHLLDDPVWEDGEIVTHF